MNSSSTSNSPPSPLTPQQEAEQRLEAERIQEVVFLLAQLFEREQGSVKAIVGCLLDVGIINFVNRRIQIRPLRPIVKPIAKVAKPALTTFGYRWIRKNCPQLVAGWLQGKVQFAPKRRPAPAQPTVTLEPAAAYQHEIRRLRSHLRLTSGALVGVSAILVLALMGVDLKSVGQLGQFRLPSATPLLENSHLKESQANNLERQNQAVD
jgi:hypothetical protein